MLQIIILLLVQISHYMQEKELDHCKTSDSGSLEIVHNDLSCYCTGPKCICDDSNGFSGLGGPYADRGGCQSSSLLPKHRYPNRGKCKGPEAHAGDLGSVNDHTFTCKEAHDGLCDYCRVKCPYCPMHGPQVSNHVLIE